ncbi:MAG: hypothetical protein WCJ64_12600 [Rhodospirillaceae bacterium]
MARRQPAPPKVTVAREGNTITVSDGARSVSSICVSPGSAKGLATRLTNDPAFAARWMMVPQPVQMDLPFEVTPGVRAK